MSYIFNGGAGGGSGTVTNIATTAPISGGPITTTGTLSGPTIVTSAAALTANQLVIGGGSQASAALGSLGTTTTLLHGNAGGAPTFAAVSLTADVTGILPPANGGAAAVPQASEGGYLMPFGYAGGLNLGSTATSTLGVNGTRAVQTVFNQIVTFTKITLNVVATSNGANYFFGFYDAAGTTLIRQVTVPLTAATGIYTITVASTTINPGVVWFTWGCDNATPTVTSYGNLQANPVTMFNTLRQRLGNSNATISGGVLPSSIGTITGANINPPIAMLE